MDDEPPNADPLVLLQQTELAIKQVELKLKERELGTPKSVLSRLKVSAVEATIIVGVLAFLGSLVGTYLQESNKLALKEQEQKSALALKEREQESALILDALKGDDSARNLDRLRLLIDAGFITDKNGTIRTLILSGKYGDAIAAPSAPTLLEAMAKGSAPALLQEIVKVIGMTPNVELREEVGFSGVAAVVSKDGHAVLIYDKSKVSAFDRNSTNGWSVPAILAHEVGHVVLGHLDRTLCFTDPSSVPICRSARDRELEADQFAGKVLRQLGSSLEQTQRAFIFLPDQSTETHPGRKERIDALLKGWKGP